MDEKTCTRCHKTKPLESFRPAKRYAGGRTTWCRDCEHDYRVTRRANAIAPAQMPEMKECKKCHQVKPGSAFQQDKVSVDGLRSWCIDCTTEYQRKWASDKRKIDADFVERSRKASREYQRRLSQDPHKAELKRQSRRQWYRSMASDPEKVFEYREKKRVYHQAIKYRPHVVINDRLTTARARARRYHVQIEPFSADDWKEMLEKFSHCCAYCGTSEKLEMDHIVPLSRGGAHAASNIVPSCKRCNSIKGTRTPAEAGMQIKYDLPCKCETCEALRRKRAA